MRRQLIRLLYWLAEWAGDRARGLARCPIDPTDPEIEQGVNLPTRAWDADSRHG